jgi:hypothetical protein
MADPMSHLSLSHGGEKDRQAASCISDTVFYYVLPTPRPGWVEFAGHEVSATGDHCINGDGVKKKHGTCVLIAQDDEMCQ